MAALQAGLGARSVVTGGRGRDAWDKRDDSIAQGPLARLCPVACRPASCLRDGAFVAGLVVLGPCARLPQAARRRQGPSLRALPTMTTTGSRPSLFGIYVAFPFVSGSSASRKLFTSPSLAGSQGVPGTKDGVVRVVPRLPRNR